MEVQIPNQNEKDTETTPEKYEGYTGFRPTDAKKPAFEFNLGQLFLGLVLVFGGLFFLAKNLGWLEVKNVSLDWQRYWPILLVFLGLAMVKTKNITSTIIGISITVLVFGVIIWVIFGMGYCGGFQF